MTEKERMIFKGKALEEIKKAWKEICEHFGIKYEEDFWDIKIIDKKEARLKQDEI